MKVTAVPGFFQGAFCDAHADGDRTVGGDGTPIGLEADGAGGLLSNTKPS